MDHFIVAQVDSDVIWHILLLNIEEQNVTRLDVPLFDLLAHLKHLVDLVRQLLLYRLLEHILDQPCLVEVVRTVGVHLERLVHACLGKLDNGFDGFLLLHRSGDRVLRCRLSAFCAYRRKRA